MAKKYAKENDITLTIFPAKWNRYGKRAGYIRNKQIWEYADMGIAFWDGKSKGTQHSFKISQEQNKKLVVIKFKNNSSKDNNVELRKD